MCSLCYTPYPWEDRGAEPSAVVPPNAPSGAGPPATAANTVAAPWQKTRAAPKSNASTALSSAPSDDASSLGSFSFAEVQQLLQDAQSRPLADVLAEAQANKGASPGSSDAWSACLAAGGKVELAKRTVATKAARLKELDTCLEKYIEVIQDVLVRRSEAETAHTEAQETEAEAIKNYQAAVEKYGQSQGLAAPGKGEITLTGSVGAGGSKRSASGALLGTDVLALKPEEQLCAQGREFERLLGFAETLGLSESDTEQLQVGKQQLQQMASTISGLQPALELLRSHSQKVRDAELASRGRLEAAAAEEAAARERARVEREANLAPTPSPTALSTQESMAVDASAEVGNGSAAAAAPAAVEAAGELVPTSAAAKAEAILKVLGKDVPASAAAAAPSTPRGAGVTGKAADASPPLPARAKQARGSAAGAESCG